MNKKRLKFLRKIDLKIDEIYILYTLEYERSRSTLRMAKRLLIYSSKVSGIANVSEDELSGFTRRSP